MDHICEVNYTKRKLSVGIILDYFVRESVFMLHILSSDE